MLDIVFLQVLDMTRTASIVILAVLLTRLLLKKAPKIFSYALWSIVLFRLLSPWAPETPVSILPATESVAENYTLAERQISPAGAVQAAYRAAGDMLNGGAGIQHIRTMETDEYGHLEYASSLWWEVWILAGKYLWLVGIAVMGIYSVLSYYRLHKKLVGAIALRDNIFLSDYIASPFVMGLFSPKIYLPSSLSDKEREYIILHEQYHIKRLDHIIKALSFLALCIHWFNPLVWLAFVLSGKDMEMSCDETVIRRMGTEIRADYCASLLSLATGRHIIAGMPLAFGEGNTKSRIKNLASWKKPIFRIVLAVATVCILLAICLLTDPMRKTDFFRCSNRHQVLDGYTVDFDLTLGNLAKSGIIYAEQWYKGECVQSSYATVTKEVNEIHILMKLTREEDIASYDGYNMRGVNIQIDSAERGGSLLTYFALPEDMDYFGWSFVTYEPGEKQEISPEDAPVLAAMAFDTGKGIRVFDCETLASEPERINRNDYMIIVRADFSDKDIPDSMSEMASSSVAEPIKKRNLENNINADIEALLSVITSSPMYSSQPMDYIEEHQAEYDKLIAYRQGAMEYCFKQFLQGGQTDLRGYIMAILCSEITENLGEELQFQGSMYANGQAWFDVFKEHAEKLAEEYTDAQLEQSYPASWLLLDIIEKSSL